MTKIKFLHCLPIVTHSLYYDDSAFINLLTPKVNTLIDLSLNSQSLNAKYNELTIFLEVFKELNITISAICLQETC